MRLSTLTPTALMMKLRPSKISPGLLLILALAATGGCQTTWVNLDNSGVEDDALRKAEMACKVAEKLDSLDQAEERKNLRLAKSKTNESKMLVKDEFALETKAIHAEIDACMRQQGLKKAD
jgi:hypothetical protein